jgi:intracellular multiplication protein IcmC
MPRFLFDKKYNLTRSWLGWVAIGMLITSPTYASTIGNFFDSLGTSLTSATRPDSMLASIGAQMPNVMRMITAFSYVMGMWMIITSLMKFKKYGEQRTMMSGEHHLRDPLTYLVTGTLMLYLPTSIQVGMSTFFANPSPFGYDTDTDRVAQISNNAYMIVQIFGTMAFIRGLLILSKTGHGGQQNETSKGLTHVIGGLFCINIFQVLQVILFTIGVPTS